MKKKIKKKGLFNNKLFKLTVVSVIAVCTVVISVTTKETSEKEKELARIQAKIDALKIENEDMQRTLDSDDLSAYMEKIALEERGYAYPNERRFYDTSRD